MPDTVATVKRGAVLPPNSTFSGHETFTFRYAWLKKGFDAFIDDPGVFNAEDAIVTLGVGKNMVRSIRHWCLASGILVEQDNPASPKSRVIIPSDFGRRLLSEGGWDPYLEDESTLWLLHWMIATNDVRASSWYWAFCVLREMEFTRDNLLHELKQACADTSLRAAEATLKSDIACLVRTYIAGKRGVTATLEDSLDCPLISLGLMSDVGDDTIRFNIGEKASLSAAVFTFALLSYWDRYFSHQHTMSLREITFGPSSPGRVFKLDEECVLQYLDQLSDVTCGAMRFEDTATTREVVRTVTVRKFEVLDAYYA